MNKRSAIDRARTLIRKRIVPELNFDTFLLEPGAKVPDLRHGTFIVKLTQEEKQDDQRVQLRS